MASLNQKDTISINQETGACFEHNATGVIIVALSKDRFLQIPKHVRLSNKGVLLDVGGTARRLAAGFQREYPE